MGWEFTLVFVALLIGIAVGVFIARMLNKNSKETQGTLNVDCSDPADGPYLYLELAVPVANVADQKQVIFDVNVIPDISQK